MDKFVRTAVVALAGTVALGTAGIAVANAQTADDDPVIKREDTSSSWVQSTTDPDDDVDPGLGQDDSPTQHSVNTVNTKNTVNTVNTKNTVNTTDTKNSVNTKNTAPTGNTAPSANTVTANTGPTDGR